MTKTTPTKAPIKLGTAANRFDRAGALDEIKRFDAALIKDCTAQSDDYIRGMRDQIRKFPLRFQIRNQIRTSPSRTDADTPWWGPPPELTDERTDADRFDRNSALDEIRVHDPALAREAADRSDAYVGGMVGQIRKMQGTSRTDSRSPKRTDAIDVPHSVAAARADMLNRQNKASALNGYAPGFDPRVDVDADTVQRDLIRDASLFVGVAPEPVLLSLAEGTKAAHQEYVARMNKMARPKRSTNELLVTIADALETKADE